MPDAVRSSGLPKPTKPKDPVCGMDVNPATARFRRSTTAKNISSVAPVARESFRRTPRRFCPSPPKPMGHRGWCRWAAGLGHADHGPAGRSVTPQARTEKRHATTSARCAPRCGNWAGPCPKCGMALDPESPTLPATKTEYTCPMHPEIVRAEPGTVRSAAWHSSRAR